MEQKTVFITGGTVNLGKATALYFAQNGYNVCLTGIDKTHAQETANEIVSQFPNIKAYGFQLELSSTDSIRKAFAEAGESVDRIDTLVANAAHLGVGLNIFNTNEYEFNEVFNVNVRGTFFYCQHCSW